MHHSVPAPALPPDPDDLYLPPDNLRVGQMAALVWSVMRLSSTNTDFAWCTVCRKWYRYRTDFNATYIKILFKHCKTQHYVAEDNTLRTITSSLPTPSAVNPRPTTVSPQLPLSSTTPLPLRPQPIPASDITYPSQQPQTTTLHHANQITQFHAQKQAQAQLAFAQAARAQAAALARAPAVVQQQHQNTLSAMHAVSQQQQLANLNARLALKQGASAETLQQVNGVNSKTAAVMQNANTAVPRMSPVIASSVAYLQRQYAAKGQIISQQQALVLLKQIHEKRAILRQQQQQRQLQQQQANQQRQQLLHRQQLGPSSAAQQQHHIQQKNVNGTRNVSLDELIAAIGSDSHTPEQLSVLGIKLPSANGHPSSQSVTVPSTAALALNNGATQAQNSVQNINAIQNASSASASPQPPTNIANGRRASASLPPPMTPASVAPPTRPTSAILDTPLRGAVMKKTGRRQVVPMMTSITRCELTAPVRKVAERSQNLIFSGTGLFFADAVFQVPSTEEEAMETMRKGTTDVDKDCAGPSNDLYFLSWGHTQFFAAQMAALGYRFLSSNLKRKAKQTHPPPVHEWLRLEKYQSIPRPISGSLKNNAGKSLSRGNQPPTAPPLSPSTGNAGGAPPHATAHAPGTAKAPVPSTPAVPSAPSQAVSSAAHAHSDRSGSTPINSNSPKNPNTGMPNSVQQSAPIPHRPSLSATNAPSARENPKHKEIPVIDLT